MSTVPSDFIPPESTQQYVRGLWGPALQESTPWVGDPFKVRVYHGMGPGGLTELWNALSDSLFAVGDPMCVLLRPQEWSVVRKLGSTVVEFEDRPEFYTVGLQAHLWGAAVICPRGGVWEQYAPKEWVPAGQILTLGLRDGHPVRHQINVEHAR